ncbi:MAG: START domain containing protein [Barrevirus sp.]|uniref:START domain containing protein n=1 Tax=Barrevirus sp. TaxID=2487763 RepID=A0A3G4ZUJ5_9VIRU|nr:MAG: START domain containing protein [Barrevirus sp.]
MFGFFGSNEQWKYDNLSTPREVKEYENVKRDIIKTTLDWTDSNDGWTHFGIVDDVTLESREIPGSGITATRGTMIFNGNNFNKFVDSLFESSDESKKKIFEDMESNTIVRTIDNDNVVIHSQFRAPPTISWREFVTLKSRTVLNDGRHVITATSINDQDVPFTKGYVRGIVVSGMVVTPPSNGNNSIKIVKVEHVDPKGWLPVSLINMMKGKVGKTLAKMPIYL